MTSTKKIDLLSGNKAHTLSDSHLGLSQENNIVKLNFKHESRPELDPLKNHRHVIHHKKTEIPYLYKHETITIGIDRSPNIPIEMLAKLAVECSESPKSDACTILSILGEKTTHNLSNHENFSPNKKRLEKTKT